MVKSVELVEVGTCFGILRSFLTTLFDLPEVLVHILPLLLAPFGIADVSQT